MKTICAQLELELEKKVLNPEMDNNGCRMIPEKQGRQLLGSHD